MLVVADHLALGLQPVADPARDQIVEREAQRHGAAPERVEHRRAHRRIEERRQHAAMHDAQRIGMLRAGQEAADRAAVLELLEPWTAGSGEAGRYGELAKAWRNGHVPL